MPIRDGASSAQSAHGGIDALVTHAPMALFAQDTFRLPLARGFSICLGLCLGSRFGVIFKDKILRGSSPKSHPTLAVKPPPIDPGGPCHFGAQNSCFFIRHDVFFISMWMLSTLRQNIPARKLGGFRAGNQTHAEPACFSPLGSRHCCDMSKTTYMLSSYPCFRSSPGAFGTGLAHLERVFYLASLSHRLDCDPYFFTAGTVSTSE